MTDSLTLTFYSFSPFIVATIEDNPCYYLFCGVYIYFADYGESTSFGLCQHTHNTICRSVIV